MVRSSSRILLQAAYVLHQRPYRDSSSLVELLSRDYGRVALVARGVRGEKSKLKGLLQVFHPLLVSWSGKGELYTLTSLEANGPPQIPTGRALWSGYYMNELLLRLLHKHDPQPKIYEVYHHSLRALAELSWKPAPELASELAPGIDSDSTIAVNQGAVSSLPPNMKKESSKKQELLLRLFEKNLLDVIGYGLILDHEVENGEHIDPGKSYRYIPEKGPVVAESSDQHPGKYNDKTSIRLHGSTLLGLAAEKLAENRELFEAKQLMRMVLANHLGEMPLKTRGIFHSQTGMAAD